MNENLQTQTPLIHKLLQCIFLNFFQEILSKFVKQSEKMSDDNEKDEDGDACLKIDYHNPDNLKDDDDILIGHGTSIAVKSLSCTQKDQFYDHVKKFYTKACDYAFHKFPFNDEMLKHANVCNLELISSASFVDVKYFIDKFPIFFILCRLQHR